MKKLLFYLGLGSAAVYVQENYWLKKTPSAPSPSSGVEWYSRAFPDRRISSVTPIEDGASGPALSRMSVHTPSSGTVTNLIVKYYDIARMAPLDCSNRLIGILINSSYELAMYKEVFFYSILNKYVTKGVKTPKVHFADMIDHGTRSPVTTLMFDARSSSSGVIVMEDMQDCTHLKTDEYFTQEQALVVVKALARFHAQTFDHTELFDSSFSTNIFTAVAYRLFFGLPIGSQWLNQFFFKEHDGRERIQPLPSKWRHEEYVGDYLQSLEVQNFIERLPSCYKLEVLPHLKNPGKTGLFDHRALVHGDCHKANMFLRPSENGGDPDLYLVDWQVYGVASPSTELSYFLNSSVKFQPELDRKLVRAYYDEFVKSLAESGSHCPQDYTLGKFERELAARNVSLSTTTLSLLILDAPDHRRNRERENAKAVVLHRAMNQNFANVMERARWNVDNSFRGSWNQGKPEYKFVSE